MPASTISSPAARVSAAVLSLIGVALAAAQALAPPPVATQPARPAPATQPARARQTPVRKAVNPHWTNTGCRHCHDPAAGPAGPIPPERVEAICVQCHDGRRARPEPHPVGRLFERTTKPPDWPAPEDKVTCITCHDIHPGGRFDGPRPADNPMFLRGWTGNILTFCGECHPATPEAHSRYNPHITQIQNGQIVAQSCEFCHTKPMPAGEQAVRTGEPALRGGPINQCVGCHNTHVDWFTPGHIGAKITSEVRIALEAVAARHGIVMPEKTGLAAGFLPLSDGDTVTCGTCHNPHQAGVFPDESPLAAGAARPPGRGNEQLRGLGKELCGACHAK